MHKMNGNDYFVTLLSITLAIIATTSCGTKQARQESKVLHKPKATEATDNKTKIQDSVLVVKQFHAYFSCVLQLASNAVPLFRTPTAITSNFLIATTNATILGYPSL